MNSIIVASMHSVGLPFRFACAELYHYEIQGDRRAKCSQRYGDIVIPGDIGRQLVVLSFNSVPGQHRAPCSAHVDCRLLMTESQNLHSAIGRESQYKYKNDVTNIFIYAWNYYETFTVLK